MDDKPVLPPAPARAPRRGHWLLVLGLGVSGALAAVGYYAVEQTAALQARVAGLDSALDALRSQHQQSGSGVLSLQSALQTLQETQDKTREELQAQTARTTALEARVAATPRADAGAFEALALAEVRALVGLAEQRLLLARDTAGASAALNLARSRLPAGQGALAVAIGQDLAQLAAFHDADLNGLAGELAALSAAAGQWPARPSAAPAAVPDATPPAAGWRDLPARLWQDLRGLIEIRQLDGAPDPLLDPEGAALARQRLRLGLDLARLAVLARDASARDAALSAATAALQAAFDAQTPEVAAAVKRLNALRETDLNPQLPALSAPAVADAAARAGGQP